MLTADAHEARPGGVAVEVLDRCAVEATDDGEVFRLYRAMVRATAITATGDLAGAAEALPGFDEVVGEPGKQAHWATALEPLVGRGGPPNDWELGVDLDTLLRRQRAEGRVRDAITIALVQARLALERHAGATARRALAAAEAERPRLAADCGTEEAIASVAARAAAAPEAPVVLPDDAETLLASLAAEDDDAESPGLHPGHSDPIRTAPPSASSRAASSFAAPIA